MFDEMKLYFIEIAVKYYTSTWYSLTVRLNVNTIYTKYNSRYILYNIKYLVVLFRYRFTQINIHRDLHD